MIDTSILWLTLALEIGLAAGYGLHAVHSWVHAGRLMYLHFCDALGRSE